MKITTLKPRRITANKTDFSAAAGTDGHADLLAPAPKNRID
jgi:hypothetical protein